MSKRLGVALLALSMVALLCGCGPGADAPGEADSRAQVLLDGQPWDGAALPAPGGDDLRVYVTLDGAPLIDVPFGEPRTLEIRLPDGGENAVEITGESVSMAHANCDNQDCVQMGAVTRDNLELRVMGGFIVCLPHKLSVEVR